MAGLTKKEIKHDEFLETATEAGHWLEEHWRLVAAILGGALVLLVVVLGGRQWLAGRSAELQDRLGAALSSYAEIDPTADDAPAALEASAESFRTLADEAGSRPEGAVARLYLGLILARQGKDAEAIDPLRSAVEDAQDGTLRQNARIALGRALAATGDLAGAEEVLRHAADDTATAFPPEEALMTLADLVRAAGDAERADAILREVAERFPDTDAARRARATVGQ